MGADTDGAAFLAAAGLAGEPWSAFVLLVAGVDIDSPGGSLLTRLQVRRVAPEKPPSSNFLLTLFREHSIT